MKAVVYREYGKPEVLQLQEVEKPIPKENEVCISVQAVSVNYGDLAARNFKNISLKEFNMPFLFWLFARFAFGFRKPRKSILGNSFAGVVESVGSKVQHFHKGEAVFGYTSENMGAYAEYLCMPESGMLTLKPSTMSYQEASALPYGALTALSLLHKVPIAKGQRVLIIGASGAIGSAALQLAKHYYGADVTAVCSTEGIDYVKSLGADKVIDYSKEDYTQSAEAYNLVFDILGKGSFSQIKKVLAPRGIYFSVSFKTKKLLQMLGTALWADKKLVCALAVPKHQDVLLIKELAEGRKLRSLIDRVYPVEQAAEAHRYLEAGKQKGAVIIQLQDENALKAKDKREE